MGSVPQATRDRLLVEASHRCTICAEKCYEIHHIVEQKDGGAHDEENLVVLCPNCHQQRVHRNKEFSETQLRMYKEKLHEANEVERRLLMNLDEIRENMPAVTPDESERRLRDVIDDAARVVSEDRSPRVVREVAEVSNWLAERELIKGGARRAIELDWEIARARERARFDPPVEVTEIDHDSWKKADEFPRAYSLDFVLNRVPAPEWAQLFQQEHKNSFYMMKRRVMLHGSRVRVIVGDTDNLQQHADWIKGLVAGTNSFIENTALPRVEAEIERQKNQALFEFDTVRSLKERTRGIEL